MSDDLYFIFLKGMDKCKIGRSNDPWKRRKQLVCGTPFDSELYGIIEDKGDIEKLVHEHFSKYHIDCEATEWFDLTREQVDEFGRDYNLKRISFESDDPAELDEENNSSDEEEIEEIEETIKTTKRLIIRKVKKSGEFQCKKCNKTFTSQQYLDSHEKRVTKCDIGHVCPKCDKSFPRAAMLKRHLDRVTSCVPEYTVDDNNTRLHKLLQEQSSQMEQITEVLNQLKKIK